MDSLSVLLQNPAIWRGATPAPVPAVATGWRALDAVLPGGGWPRGALTEVHAGAGVGELSLLLPALARIAQEGRPQVWVAPPMVPYAPALDAIGFDLAQLLIVQPPVDADVAWSVEECLRVDGCGAVLAWTPALDGRALRRLQLAAAASGACGFLFPAGDAHRQPSPAALRVAVAPATAGLEVTLLKARGVRTRKVLLEESPDIAC